MKYLPAQIVALLQKKSAKRDLRVLFKFLLVLVLLVSTYSILFHVIMMYHEDRYFSWITGVYWTFVVMSTLGFGDITFHTDLGFIFSLIVLLSGVVFLLVMLPFTFIQFFYAPWLEAQSKSRVIRTLPEDTENHVIVVGVDPISLSLDSKLKQYNRKCYLVVEDQQVALGLYEQGYRAVLGELDDIETYRKIQADKAALIVVNSGEDKINTNIVYTLRELCEKTPIVSNASDDDSVDILELAGSSHVYQFTKMLGQSLARRVLGVSMRANIIGRFDDLLIAEVPAMRSSLEGKTILESRLRELTGITVAGVWERGKYKVPLPDTIISASTVLVLAGSDQQLAVYDEKFGGYATSEAPVLILGGGRVGRAAADTLKARGVAYKIVEKNVRAIKGAEDEYVHGSAADLDTLRKAGIDTAPSVIVTTHDDDMNIYLTIYCRRLRPDIQIITRATLDRNISKLHRAGADLVMSYASMGVTSITNYLLQDNTLMVSEGLNIFKMPAPKKLVGKTLEQSNIRQKTGCNVIAIDNKGQLNINPSPGSSIDPDTELIMIGNAEAEQCFMGSFTNGD
ncbi:TrkA family potassium uptake protein [Desulfonatronum sp. SC1]|uniref:potassium channel family protein n=1 Tax=Desulfonatronum sp. SC1 TaxID=2109626 RepID=UPI000D2FB4DD|nr:NAD-binding protein [Desulfonatronum sp. SC1]PTN38661.1 potassium transporter TrkA [Desulfonatronum sp. SC1]